MDKNGNFLKLLTTKMNPSKVYKDLNKQKFKVYIWTKTHVLKKQKSKSGQSRK